MLTKGSLSDTFKRPGPCSEPGPDSTASSCTSAKFTLSLWRTESNGTSNGTRVTTLQERGHVLGLFATTRLRKLPRLRTSCFYRIFELSYTHMKGNCLSPGKPQSRFRTTLDYSNARTSFSVNVAFANCKASLHSNEIRTGWLVPTSTRLKREPSKR